MADDSTPHTRRGPLCKSRSARCDSTARGLTARGGPWDACCTLFFPFSADPAGFHHLATAEWLLRCRSELRKVVFMPSNGHHPDPLKATPYAPARWRLHWLVRLLREAGTMQHSDLARQAQRSGTELLLNPQRVGVSRFELRLKRPVRMVEHVAWLRAQGMPKGQRLHWLVGSDLIQRMGDARIFSAADLRVLAHTVQLHALQRGTIRLQQALERVASRGVRLELQSYTPPQGLPWLARPLRLSSTHIRRAAAAGDPLEGMLSAGVARALVRSAAYTAVYTPADTAHSAYAVPHTYAAQPVYTGPRKMPRLRNATPEKQIAMRGAELSAILQDRSRRGLPHRLAIVETSAGGRIAQALSAAAGASAFLIEARLAYSPLAQNALLAAEPGAAGESAVSRKRVRALAQAMRAHAQSDYALAESGVAGPPDGKRRSEKHGICWIAVDTPQGTFQRMLRLHPYATRAEHQIGFALAALNTLALHLDAPPEKSESASGGSVEGTERK